MDLLKKEYWWAWLLFFLLGNTVSLFILGAILKIYNKNAWYAKWEYWVLGLLCFVFPFFIMLSIFSVQITVKVAETLNVSGRELYTSPYVWMLLLIIPIIGWFLIPILVLYLNIAIIVAMAHGEGERFLY